MKKLICYFFGHERDFSLEVFKKEIGYDHINGGSWIYCKRCKEYTYSRILDHE